jgi:hypothetical protein
MKYLEFEDITDFDDPFQTKDFEEVKFFSQEHSSESATDNESCSEELECKVTLLEQIDEG